jgi:hypothetical protein
LSIAVISIPEREYFLQLTFTALSRVPSLESQAILNKNIFYEQFRSKSFLAGFETFQKQLQRLGLSEIYGVGLDNALHFTLDEFDSDRVLSELCLSEIVKILSELHYDEEGACILCLL